MIIKKIELRNIRSYVSEEIEFPNGSVLLSGEIGSGKSSILLAVEFALFGIARGVLSGTSLLRVGTDKGHVVLSFKAGKKDIVIKRTLKRSSGDVRQDSGYIIIDGKKEEASPVELKSRVLELLGYPEELLTKSKSLIYRYTVYTPQEEMKRILTEQSQYRLETLRKIFQMDRYKKIRENAGILIDALKDRSNELRGQVHDLDDKKEALLDIKDDLEEKEKILEVVNEKSGKLKQKIDDKKKEIEKNEKKAKELNELKNKRDILHQRLKDIVKNSNEKSRKIKELENESEEIEKRLESIEAKKIDIEPITKKLEQAQKKKDNLIKNQAEYRQEIKNRKQKIKDAKELMEKISSLAKCPLCLQDVSKSHIERIINEKKQEIEVLEDDIGKFEQKLDKTKKDLEELGIEKLKEKEKKAHEQNLRCQKKKNLSEKLDEKKNNISELREELKELKKQIGRINIEKREISEEIADYKEIGEKTKSLKKEFDELQKKEKKIDIEKTKIKTEVKSLNENKERLQKEITEKKEAKKELKSVSRKQGWLADQFVPLMVNMEQHVMMRVFQEFNEIFQEFFDILLEGEYMSVRLDEEFSPVINQRGHEISYEDLSGGEKTSIALAYRLALNKVINDIIENIKTKDIIVLDEPTDGFSTQQLDKIRDVLDILNIKQTILVSHESKIESFVENIIHITKRQNISRAY